ncbi:hypothetical protein [Microbacterium paraoxydans]|uniref:hypothetical protein n=1 Tax=Microbacterium paraoxydans TaxID=199592 RepID=UPI003D72A99D
MERTVTSPMGPLRIGRIRALSGLIVGLTIIAFSSLGPAQSAQAATNWSIRATFVSASTGDDVPLRWGRTDTATQTGFGWNHMVKRYHATEASYRGWVSKIDYTLDHCKAVSIGGGKYSCSYALRYNSDWKVNVIFSDRIDSGSADHRPVGIITAYLVQVNCGC